MKYIFIALLIPPFASAEIITTCGRYSASGVIRANDNELSLVINEKTKSEYIISMPMREQAKVAGFIDRDVAAEILVEKKFNGQKVMAYKIDKVELRLPDPLNPASTLFTLIKKLDCK